MKFLFLSDVCFDLPSSGSERVLREHVTGLSRNNHSISAITRKNSNFFKSRVIDNNGVLNGYYSLDLKLGFRSLLNLIKEPPRIFDKLINNAQLTAVISHQPFTCFSLFFARKMSNIPLIYVFHSPNHEEYILANARLSNLARKPVIQLRRMIEKFCLKKAKRVMVLSHFMKQKVIDLHRISTDRIIVNPGGVDLDRFKPIKNREMVKNDLGFRKKRIHLLTVRNLEPRMGLDNLLQTIKIMKHKMKKVHLTIGGEGPEKDRLQRLIKELDLMDDVTMTGFISAEQLPLYYAAADFFILPTSELEGFGLVTPESMACGTPVLGTPVGGTKEILSPFNPKFLFKDSSPEAIAIGIEEAINHFFNDQNEFNKLRLNCREYVEKNYSWQRHTKQLTSIIAEAISVNN
jgi:glycosyltransferase involved in cell wall biosynthesis